jgi:hypothetical protein
MKMQSALMIAGIKFISLSLRCLQPGLGLSLVFGAPLCKRPLDLPRLQRTG